MVDCLSLCLSSCYSIIATSCRHGNIGCCCYCTAMTQHYCLCLLRCILLLEIALARFARKVQIGKIRLKSLLVLRTRENHPTLRKSANGIAASSLLRQNQSFEVKFLVPSQKLKWMLKYCSYLKYFLIIQLQRYPSRVVYMFRQISYLGPELRAFSGQEKLTFLRKFI